MINNWKNVYALRGHQINMKRRKIATLKTNHLWVLNCSTVPFEGCVLTNYCLAFFYGEIFSSWRFANISGFICSVDISFTSFLSFSIFGRFSVVFHNFRLGFFIHQGPCILIDVPLILYELKQFISWEKRCWVSPSVGQGRSEDYSSSFPTPSMSLDWVEARLLWQVTL